MNEPPRENATPSYHGRPRPEHVLIVAHGDGFVEVFAEGHVAAKIVIAPFMASAEGEILAEEFVDLTLPKPYRDLHVPCKRTTFDQVRTITPQDIADRDLDLQILRSIDRVNETLRGDDAEGGFVWTL